MSFSIPDWYVNGESPFYSKDRVLLPGVGNNSFSMERRLGRESLHVTPMRVGSLDDLRIGSEVVFQDFNEHGEWKKGVGLESAILCLDYAVPMYVVDNHNHAFYAWVEYEMTRESSQKDAQWSPVTLVHMDAHFDDATPTSPPNHLSLSGDVEPFQVLEQVWKYTNDVLQIATYIRPALDLGFFNRVVNYVESKDFESGFSGLERMNKVDGDVVLNVDLDVFSEEMSHVSFERKVSVLKTYLPQARLITFATSPSFIDQEKAILICKKVVEELFGI